MSANHTPWTVDPKTPLRDYFDGVFAKRMHVEAHKYAQSYVAAVDRFHAFMRGDIALRDVTEQKLDQFCDWLIGRARAAPSTVHTYAKRIRRIVREASGGTVFPKQNGQHETSPPGAVREAKDDPKLPKLARKGNMTLRAFLENYYLREKQLAPQTQRQMRMAVAAFDKWAGREVRFYELRELLNEWLRSTEGSHKPKTIKNRRGYIVSLWSYAAECGRASDPPVTRIRKVRVPKPVPDAWTHAELAAMFDACTLTPNYFPNGIPVGPFLRALIMVGYDTGLRGQDLFLLRFDALQAQIRMVQQKTGWGHIAPLGEDTLEAIAETVPPRRELVFPWPYRRETFHLYWTRMLRRAGLPTGRRECLQKLRRTSASHLARENPGAVMRHLGHKDPSMAPKHYIDPRIGDGPRPLPPRIEWPKRNGSIEEDHE